MEIGFGVLADSVIGTPQRVKPCEVRRASM
jgi:hypothetical protein